MSRINTNTPSLVARANLARSNQALEVRLQRLSTGLRINRGADDPAGLIASERLRTEIRGVDQGIKNADRASSVIATAEGSLSEVSDLLNSIKSLIVESANTGGGSPAEREANQLQIDSAIDSITRISNTASFAGLKLLNGSLDYNLSGIATSAIAKAQVYGASLINNEDLQVTVDVLASAQRGALFMRGDYAGAPSFDGTVMSTTTLRIAGGRGVGELTIISGTSLTSLAAAVNNLTELTGVEAVLVDAATPASGLIFRSVDFGSRNFVSVQRLGGPTDTSNYFHTYKLADSSTYPDFDGATTTWDALISSGLISTADRDDGRDVSALVNGTLASGDGTGLAINSPALSLRLNLSEEFATRPTATASSFYITGGGALFQLGPQVTAQQQVQIGVQSVASSALGGTLIDGSLQYLNAIKSGQAYSIAESVRRGDFTQGSSILDNAIDEVSVLRGRLGAFERNVLQTNVRSLQAAFENLSASESRIRDADFAEETSALTRAQILVSAGTSVLALANQQTQNALQLLG